MNIAVYCASRDGAKSEYLNIARQVGEAIARGNHTLVFGASDSGMMGAVAHAVMENGGRATGVVPDVEGIREMAYNGLSETLYADTMAARRSAMIERAQGYICLPGGIGTLDEISEVMCLNHLKVEKKPICLINVCGYYDKLRDFLQTAVSEGFLPEKDFKSWVFVKDAQEAVDFIVKNGGQNGKV
ncbi:MAG: TIGR00730 family Rossman fold protein [Clostridiales bacterium]|nr:TIGR00730 family Rossman fold protein [Clostridiales bacterium]